MAAGDAHGNVNSQPQMNPCMNYKAQQDMYQKQAIQAMPQTISGIYRKALEVGGGLSGLDFEDLLDMSDDLMY